MKKISILLTTLFSTMSLSQTKSKVEELQLGNPHCIVVVLEAKQGKEEELKQELLKVANLGRKEGACLNYIVHEDLVNPGKFILYENWTSKDEHAKQFEKPYIIELGKKLSDLTDKPFQYFTASVIK